MNTGAQSPVFLYSAREWRILGLCLAGYLTTHLIAAYALPNTWIDPSPAIALAALFFGGMRLLPLVFLTTVVADFFSPSAGFATIASPLGATLQAVLGAHLLHRFKLDPIYRSNRGMLITMGTCLVISLITPTFAAIATILDGESFSLSTWGFAFTATLFSLVVTVPLILRWSAKFRFVRTWLEWAGILVTGLSLAALNYTIFIAQKQTVLGIPIAFLLLAILFVIALKLRPRFITLALFITSIFGIIAAYLSDDPMPLLAMLVRVELFVIALAGIFYMVSALEEDRRLTMNLARSQLATLENMLARAMSESKAKNDFLAILAHELRNPLAPIASSIDLLRAKDSHEKENRELIEIMHDCMGTVRRLLDDLLDISRISEGKISMKREQVDLDAVLQRAILTTEHYRYEFHQSLVLRPHARRLSVLGDAIRLEQVFSNLLANASKYSDPGDTITITVQSQGGWAEVAITDEGVGLDPDEIKTIFQPFRQIDHGERTQKGLGIGLALVKNFVELHDGSVHVRSSGKDSGTTFTVRLPVIEMPTQSEMRYSMSTPKKEMPQQTPLVLIADDNDAASGAMGRLLGLIGYRVAYAYDAAESIQKIMSLSPDAVLLDIGLPDQDGYEVAKAVRNSGYRGVLIALTGFSGEDSKREGKEAGFDHYVVKPAGLADLRRVLPSA